MPEKYKPKKLKKKNASPKERKMHTRWETHKSMGIFPPETWEEAERRRREAHGYQEASWQKKLGKQKWAVRS